MLEGAFDYVEVARMDEIPIGGRLFIEVDELPIVIFNLNGILCAIKDECTHDHGPLGDGRLDGNVIVCPRHGARFEVCSGKVLSAPAFVNTVSYPVRVDGDVIKIGIPL